MFESILVLYGYENVDDGCSNGIVDRDRLGWGGGDRRVKGGSKYGNTSIVKVKIDRVEKSLDYIV